MADEDPFKILGVNRHATRHEIKKAYRDLAKLYHPDRHSGADPAKRDAAEIQFKRVQHAYAEVTGGNRMLNPAAWAQAAADAELKKPVFTNRQLILGMMGASVACTGFMFIWSHYLTSSHYNQIALKKNKTMTAYAAQTRRWQEEKSEEEYARLVEERKSMAISHAIDEAQKGAVEWGICGVTGVLGLKGAERMFPQLFKYEFINFHVKPQMAAFYITGSIALGFYIHGSKAISPKGSLYKHHQPEEMESQ